MQGIAHWIESRAISAPHAPALVGEARRRTYREMAADLRRMAAILRARGIGQGDRVAILAANSVEYLELLFAVAALGAIAVPLNIRLADEELAYQLADSGSSLIVADPEHAGRAARLLRHDTPRAALCLAELPAGAGAEPPPLPAVDAALPCLICYTSGTTGRPKGAVLTQENLFWNAVNDTLALELTAADRFLALLPLFHIGGIGAFALPVLFAGGTVVVPRRFEPGEALRLIAAERITVLMGVPTMHDAIRRHPDFPRADLGAVRWWYSGGAPCPPALIEDLLARGLPFGQGYGLTETAPTVLMLGRGDHRERAGSVGKPVLFTAARVAGPAGKDVPAGAVGELLVRGPNVFRGYWNQPEATAAAFRDGWFRTGDLARTDADGFYHIVGRRTDLIISGGENIYPLEVEQALARHPAVVEVAVVGAPDPRWGEAPVAFVVLHAGRRLAAEALREHCAARLVRYKCPREIAFLPELPRTASGKVAKAALARRLREGARPPSPVAE